MMQLSSIDSRFQRTQSLPECANPSFLPSRTLLPSLMTPQRFPSLSYTSPKQMRMANLLNDEGNATLSPKEKRMYLPPLHSIMKRESVDHRVSPVQARSQPMSMQNFMDGHIACEALAQLAISPLHRSVSSSSTASSSASDEYTKKRCSSGKLCERQDCVKRAKAGGFCIAHGGGLRCSVDACSKHAVSLGLCISHGGGKRCKVEMCTKASRKNGLCWSHGGKRLCKREGCMKGPKSGGFCWGHGVRPRV